ncbi:conserved exported hypothetical protein [Candidatus Sulfopaludibacter sp. SbA4]|nr:conserved exported hypothetical protein [Candidatus Sulfopaludibacter sp. SbA4]
MKARIFMLAVSLAVLMSQFARKQQAQDSQPPAKQTDSTNTKPAATAAPAEMKTMTYKGVLVDMSCASHTSSAAATPENATPPAADSEKANSANRAASDSGASCPVSASSTELGMKLDDGKTVRFDLVGNQRAQDELKNNKSWSKEIGAGRPIHAKVSGVMSGEKLVVSSIH